MGSKVEVTAGDRYGRLTVVREIEPVVSSVNNRKYRRVEFTCECGQSVTANLEAVRQGGTRSCGCLNRDSSSRSGRNNKTHGLTNCRTYVSWTEMKRRCYVPDRSEFESYGERGITVCERWMNSFENFIEDMGERPQGCTIDRIDNDGDYCLENCRWATQKEQQRNRRSNVLVTFQGQTMCISEWAERTGIPRKTLEKRLGRYGFTVEEALTSPLRSRRVSP